MLFYWDLAGVFVASASGGLAGRQKGMDWFGSFMVGLATGVGGGTLRCVLLGDVPPPVLVSPGYLLVAMAATATARCIEPKWARIRRLVSLMDAIALGVFMGIGVRVSQQHGLDWWPCICLGVITATFGGVLRDLMSAEVPLIFRKEIYATAAAIGAAALLGMDALGVPPDVSLAGSIGIVMAIRLLAIRYALNQSS